MLPPPPLLFLQRPQDIFMPTCFLGWARETCQVETCPGSTLSLSRRSVC